MSSGGSGEDAGQTESDAEQGPYGSPGAYGQPGYGQPGQPGAYGQQGPYAAPQYGPPGPSPALRHAALVTALRAVDSL